MPRKIAVDLPDEMYELLEAYKDKLSVPIAAQIRQAIQKDLASKGKVVSAKLPAWGGKREPRKKAV